MLTRHQLAKRWHTTPRTIDRRRAMGLLPWIDLARGVANGLKFVSPWRMWKRMSEKHGCVLRKGRRD